MKRNDLIKLLIRNGWHFVRNGGNHDIYSNGKRIEPIETQGNSRTVSKINN